MSPPPPPTYYRYNSLAGAPSPYYYYNAVTGESVWSLPEGENFVDGEERDADGDGNDDTNCANNGGNDDNNDDKDGDKGSGNGNDDDNDNNEDDGDLLSLFSSADYILEPSFSSNLRKIVSKNRKSVSDLLKLAVGGYVNLPGEIAVLLMLLDEVNSGGGGSGFDVKGAYESVLSSELSGSFSKDKSDNLFIDSSDYKELSYDISTVINDPSNVTVLYSAFEANADGCQSSAFMSYVFNLCFKRGKLRSIADDCASVAGVYGNIWVKLFVDKAVEYFGSGTGSNDTVDDCGVAVGVSDMKLKELYKLSTSSYHTSYISHAVLSVLRSDLEGLAAARERVGKVADMVRRSVDSQVNGVGCLLCNDLFHARQREVPKGAGVKRTISDLYETGDNSLSRNEVVRCVSKYVSYKCSASRSSNAVISSNDGLGELCGVMKKEASSSLESFLGVVSCLKASRSFVQHLMHDLFSPKGYGLGGGSERALFVAGCVDAATIGFDSETGDRDETTSGVADRVTNFVNVRIASIKRTIELLQGVAGKIVVDFVNGDEREIVREVKKSELVGMGVGVWIRLLFGEVIFFFFLYIVHYKKPHTEKLIFPHFYNSTNFRPLLSHYFNARFSRLLVVDIAPDDDPRFAFLVTVHMLLLAQLMQAVLFYMLGGFRCRRRERDGQPEQERE